MDALMSALRDASDPNREKFLASYFGAQSSTAFPGLTAVAARRVAVRFADRFDLSQLRPLLASRVPEHRFVALEMLVRKYEAHPADRRQRDQREKIAGFYRSHLRYVDHWVLVDTSAPYILGDSLRDKPKTLLYRLARSKRLAERRIAIVATWAFIKAGDFTATLRIADLLLSDEEELIQRAVGWMLREVGKRSLATLEAFLAPRACVMPRLMLRSAVERFPPAKRSQYLGSARNMRRRRTSNL
jgi:3-methyladenine DNA glycosylase AlkD